MIKFTYNKESELKDILWIYSEYDFFIKHKYKVFYPNISKDLKNELIHDCTSKDAQQKLEREFAGIFASDEKTYKKTLLLVGSGWLKIEKDFFSELSELQPKMILPEYQCFISRYGPGGTCYPPNKVSVRIVKEFDQDITEANEKIAHEMVHLVIDGLVKKFKLNFENTERLVDLILTKTLIARLLTNPTMQGFGDERLDQCFKSSYPDIEEVLKEFTVS